MKDNDIILAIRYALRKEGIGIIVSGEYGEYDVELEEEDAESVLPFVKCLLRELRYEE